MPKIRENFESTPLGPSTRQVTSSPIGPGGAPSARAGVLVGPAWERETVATRVRSRSPGDA